MKKIIISAAALLTLAPGISQAAIVNETSLPTPNTAVRTITPTVTIDTRTCTNCNSPVTAYKGTWNFTGQTIYVNWPVTVWQSVNNGAWMKVGTVNTNAVGVYTVSGPVGAAGTTRFAATIGTNAPGTAGTVVGYGTTATVAPAPVTPPSVTINAGTNVPFYKYSFRVQGVIKPAKVGTVTIQRLVNGVWQNYSTVTTSSTGAWYKDIGGMGVNTLNTYTFRAKYGTVYSPVTNMFRVLPANSTRLTDAQARGALTSKAIEVKSSGGCTNRYQSNCTSLDTIRTGTIREIINLDNLSKCNLVVTGGTEVGHASGTYSHWNGYKFDISMSSCYTTWIKGHAAKQDATHWYRTPTMFYNEVNHWDHVVKN